MNKEISIFPFEDEIIISSSFFLERGHSNLNDAYFESFRTIVHSFDSDADYDTKQVSLSIDVDLEELKKKFNLYGFTIKEKKFSVVEKKSEETQQTKPTETLVFNETLQLRDVQKYIENGRQFLDGIRIGSSIRLGEIIRKTFTAYPFEDKDYYFIPIEDFINLVETKNNFILRLAPKFKGKSSLDTLLEWRTGKLGETYKDFYKKHPADTLQAGQTFDGFEVIEGFRIYQYLYKFGSKNIKHYGVFGDWMFLRPFRWNHILFIKRSFLSNTVNTTVIRLDQPSALP